MYEVLPVTNICAKHARFFAKLSYPELLELYLGAGFFCNAANESFSMLFVLVSACCGQV